MKQLLLRSERDEKIINEYHKDPVENSVVALADKYSLTRQRVWQIVSGYDSGSRDLEKSKQNILAFIENSTEEEILAALTKLGHKRQRPKRGTKKTRFTQKEAFSFVMYIGVLIKKYGYTLRGIQNATGCKPTPWHYQQFRLSKYAQKV